VNLFICCLELKCIWIDLNLFVCTDIYIYIYSTFTNLRMYELIHLLANLRISRVTYNYAVTAYQAGTSLNLRLSLWAPGTLRHSYLPRLKNTAIYHTAAAGRSKWPLAPARSRRTARNGSSSPLGAAMALEMAAQ